MTRTPGVDERRRQLRRRRVGQRQKHDVGLALSASGSSGVIAAVPQPGERRAAAAPRMRDPDDVAQRQPHRGMARQQPQQFLAGVAGRAGDGDARQRGARRLGDGVAEAK